MAALDRLAALRGNKKKHDSLLSYYGPLSLLLLLAFWALTLVLGFGLLHYGLHDKLSGALFASDFGNALYLSGTTLFTLGLGDVLPASPLGRFITVLEVRNRLRLSRLGHWLPAGAVSGIFAP